MAILVDTSVWVNVLRDSSGIASEKVQSFIGNDEMVLSRLIQLELLQGSKDEREWSQLSDYLNDQVYLDINETTWVEAARTYYDLCRLGLTVRSPIDCCIAQIAMDHEVLLLHEDKDFEAIANIRPLMQSRC